MIIMKKTILIISILSCIAIYFWYWSKAYATNNTWSLTSTWKVGRVENIKIIRKKSDKVGRVENIKIIRKSRKIVSWVNDIKNDKVVIIKPDWRDHIFLPKWSTTKKVSQDYNAKYVINGSYFRADEDKDFHPAGTMGTDGKSKFTKDLCNDVNLCGIYDLNTLEIQKDMYEGTLDWNFRSSGPLLMREGKISDNISKNISHRNRKTTRTALINTTTPHFIYSKTGMTLLDFTTVIKKYFPTWSAINLDGWSSTSFYSKDVSFNSSKLLPEFFLLR